jgi:hypothetical protein
MVEKNVTDKGFIACRINFDGPDSPSDGELLSPFFIGNTWWFHESQTGLSDGLAKRVPTAQGIPYSGLSAISRTIRWKRLASVAAHPYARGK